MVVFELPCPNSRAGDSPVMAPSGAFFPLCDISASGMRPLKLASQPRPCLMDIWQCALFRQHNLSLGRLPVIVFARAIKCMMRGGCCDNASGSPQDDIPDPVKSSSVIHTALGKSQIQDLVAACHDNSNVAILLQG